MDLSLLSSWLLLREVVGTAADLYERREATRRQADFERYRRWTCPDCDMPFGDDVFYVNTGKPYTWHINGRSFTVEVTIVCPRCVTINIYDPTGTPFLEQGTPFDPDEDFGSDKD
jgi:hypothetical protein